MLQKTVMSSLKTEGRENRLLSQQKYEYTSDFKCHHDEIDSTLSQILFLEIISTRRENPGGFEVFAAGFKGNAE